MIKSLKIFLFILIFLSALFFYTNTQTQQRLSLTSLQTESRTLSDRLRLPSATENVKRYIRIHKQRVTSAIARVSSSQNCTQLFSNDRFMISGRYVLSSNSGTQALYECTVTSGQLARGELVRRLPARERCTGQECADRRPIYQTIFCISELNKRQRCPLSDIIGVPEFVAPLSGSAACTQNVNYGISQTQVWTEDGCQGRFRVRIQPSSGLASRYEEALLKDIDKTNPFATVALQTFKTQRDSAEALNLTRLRSRLENYLQARTVGSTTALEDASETTLSRIGQKLTQKLIHYNELSSCGELRSYLSSKNIFSGFTGPYYFYSSTVQKNHNPILQKRTTTRAVDAEPQFCDFTQLLEREDSSASQSSDTYDANLTLQKIKDIYATSAGLSQLQRSNRFVVKASEYDGCPNGRIARCIAKKYVKYSDEGPYSFIDTSHFGEQLYEVNGLKFCFNSNEEFEFDFNNLAHGYLCIPSWNENIPKKTFNHFLSVSLGAPPPVSNGVRQLEAIGCLSKQQASSHFRRNDRAILVGDDLRGVSRNIHANTVNNVKKHYCLPTSMTTPVFAEEDLVAAYLLPNPDGTNRQSEVDIRDRAIERAIDGSFTLQMLPTAANQPRSFRITGSARHKGTALGVELEAYIVKGNGDLVKVKTLPVPSVTQSLPRPFTFDITGSEVIVGRNFRILAKSGISGVPNKLLNVHQSAAQQIAIPPIERACSVPNGTGVQTMQNANSWGTCLVTSCCLHCSKFGNTCWNGNDDDDDDD